MGLRYERPRFSLRGRKNCAYSHHRAGLLQACRAWMQRIASIVKETLG